MIGAVISALGIFLTGIGTFIRVVPDLDRRLRQNFYSNAAFTHNLFSIRGLLKNSDRGRKFTIEHRRVCKELVDYVDAHDINDPPDQIPEKIRNGAARIEAEYSDGTKEYFLEGQPSQRTLVELLTLSIERSCRNSGLVIAVIGTLLAIGGTLLPV